MKTLALLILLLAVQPAHAQSSDGSQPTREQILQRLTALETEIAQLKATLQRTPEPALPPVAGPPPAQNDTPVLDYLRDLKFGAALDTYYGYNFNRPVGRVNLLRAYDVLSNNFTISQASMVIEAVPHPDAGRRFGGRVDLQFGQATETLQGSLANEPRPWVYRNIFQAFGTFVAPLGSGLTVDFGKWASALGYENNYAKDQINYSRSYWFNFLPFYHAGGRLTYRFSDGVAFNYWISNGTQQTEEFNNFKDQFFGLVLAPAKPVTWNVQYYLGQEHPDVQVVDQPGPPVLPTQPGLSIVPVDPYFRGKLQIFDSYVTWTPTASTAVAVEGDYVTNGNPAPAGVSRVSGGAAYVRRQLTRRSALGVRGELLVDHNGLFSGQSQRLTDATVTYDYRVNDGFLVRTEWRRDGSNKPFFLTGTVDERKTSQTTATLGLIWWWGTKPGAW
jgi:putative OmpL-like beta-barrel porin-2